MNGRGYVYEYSSSDSLPWSFGSGFHAFEVFSRAEPGVPGKGGECNPGDTIDPWHGMEKIYLVDYLYARSCRGMRDGPAVTVRS
ncbi:hypothetical protein Ssi02_32470 [Sinosporangium siamense]|uniref:Uncharacterized protein n=1 Tax=Sinosporangium siamense TaxID=1367973 RepID=A0A919V7F0_9ACTN|nr:hypothetical protein Ssi02_32470 [Sinosporangium siamense]